MKEIKELYAKLNPLDSEDRSKLWEIILEKNRALFQDNMRELKKAISKC